MLYLCKLIDALYTQPSGLGCGLYLANARGGDRQIAERDLASTTVNAFSTVRELVSVSAIENNAEI